MCLEGILILNVYLLNLSYQIWVRLIFVYQKSSKHMFKTRFWIQNTFLFCDLVLKIHKGYFVVKKLVWEYFFCWKLFGSSWLSARSYFHHLIYGRQGQVSFLLELTNSYNICTKNICLLRFKWIIKSFENCILHLTNLNQVFILKNVLMVIYLLAWGFGM